MSLIPKVKCSKNFKTHTNYEYSNSISIHCQSEFFYILYIQFIVKLLLI